MNKRIEDALHSGFSQPIRDAIWGHIYLTPELKAITRSAPFARMHRILQLGPAEIVYPGASHTRAAHSIGVYYITRRLLNKLMVRGAGEYVTFTGVRSMLCAALLHDVGHFPYAHSLNELPLSRHETLSAQIIKSPAMKALIEAAGGDADMTAAIVDFEEAQGINEEVCFYRKLISGCLDPDKLDYLNRDARYCGIPYGNQDIDFTLSMLRPHKERGVDIESPGIASVESVLFAKYLMYRSVYWHHSVRSADAMIKKAIYCGINDKIIEPKELYQLDDMELFALFRERSLKTPIFELGNMVRSGNIYKKVAEFNYKDVENHGLSDIKTRTNMENDLALKYSKITGKKIDGNQIIIDVPDSISFETKLFVRGPNCFFDESSSVFKKSTVKSFADTLRMVRVFASPQIAGLLHDVEL
ncbi:MAG: HD domain-containing protein [Termitinemataceae bacterium]|nr:MAG: HD domain-containing protein [Termitinemataceae bacterium]